MIYYIPNIIIYTFLLTYRTSFLSKITNAEPARYKLNKTVDNIICVIGSVEGVITADTSVQMTITYFHNEKIYVLVKLPNKPDTTSRART